MASWSNVFSLLILSDLQSKNLNVIKQLYSHIFKGYIFLWYFTGNMLLHSLLTAIIIYLIHNLLMLFLNN